MVKFYSVIGIVSILSLQLASHVINIWKILDLDSDIYIYNIHIDIYYIACYVPKKVGNMLWQEI